MFEDFTFENAEVSEQDEKFFVDGMEIKELDFDAFKETYLTNTLMQNFLFQHQK